MTIKIIKTIKIYNLSGDDRRRVCDVVDLCVIYWPNAHLGDETPHQDIKRAFARIRAGLLRGHSIDDTLWQLEADAYRHADM